MKSLNNTVENIEGIDESLYKKGRDYWDDLVHPTGSLGELEEIGIKLYAIQGGLPKKLKKRAILVMCSDNGIIEENVSSSPRHLTRSLALAMGKGKTGVSALSKDANAEVFVVDLGIYNFEGSEDVIDRRISNSTKNFLKEDAMTYDQATQAIEVGIDLADELFKKGYDVLGAGELGMGNTTTSSAVISALTGEPAEKTVGLGSGVDSVQLQNKLNAVKNGILLRKPDVSDPVDVLAKIGGYDIAAITGVYLSAAKNKKPAVIDGIITAAAALCAYKINPNVKNYLFGSHIPKEHGAKIALDEIGIRGYMDLAMRLGEGSGCPLMFKLMDSSIFAMNNMAHFNDVDIVNVLVNIRD